MIQNLEKMYALADAIDHNEGQLAYLRYHQLMKAIAAFYNYPLQAVIAVFVSLSPNNDYFGNLRSTLSVLQGLNDGRRSEDITVSTYNHCKERAIEYALGRRCFLEETKGPKILNFYHNILDPNDTRWVTIDGHMTAIWRGENLTMREALVSAREYREIASAIKSLAFRMFLVPNQLQAILWFTRKRLFRVKFDPQMDLIRLADNDVWKTIHNIEDIRPYDPPRDRSDINERIRLQVEQARNIVDIKQFGFELPKPEQLDE